MHPVRNWILIALVFAFGFTAFAWYSFAPVPELELDEEGQPTSSSLGRVINWYGVLILLAAGAMLFFVLWFALSNRDLNRVTDRWLMTPLWTFLLFVPLVQFVSLYMMAQHIHKAQTATGKTGLNPIALFVPMWLLIPLGLILAQLQLQKVDWNQSRTPWWWGHAQPAGGTNKGLHVEEEPDATPIRPKKWITADESPLELDERPREVLGMRVRPEVAPMPASGVATYFFCIASLPLALLGPAGIAAGLAGLYSRERFLDLESRAPGHRGGRATKWLQLSALAGLGASFVVSSWMLTTIFLAT